MQDALLIDGWVMQGSKLQGVVWWAKHPTDPTTQVKGVWDGWVVIKDEGTARETQWYPSHTPVIRVLDCLSELTETK